MSNKIKTALKMSSAKLTPGIFKLPYFSVCVFKILSIKFPHTYIVGGAVRNILLGKKVVDIDIATSATPNEVAKLLRTNGISFSVAHQKFGVVVAKSEVGQSIEITTFRKESYGKSRFPKVEFVRTPRQDSRRRDFTVNALYYNPSTNSVYDFYRGLEDIKAKRLKFIGQAQRRIQEDPLRIIRAYRFALQYGLSIDERTEKILQTHKFLINQINNSRIQREIESISSTKVKNLVKKVIHNNS